MPVSECRKSSSSGLVRNPSSTKVLGMVVYEDDVESGLFDPAISAAHPLSELRLDGGAERQAGVQVHVLPQRQRDVSVRVVGIETIVILLVAFLFEHGCILLAWPRAALFDLCMPHHVGARAFGARAVESVAVDGDEQVGLGLVRHANPITKGRKLSSFLVYNTFTSGRCSSMYAPTCKVTSRVTSFSDWM